MHPQDSTRRIMTEYTCRQCGDTFHVTASRSARGEVRFCSRACTDVGKPHPRKPLAERFWAKVDKTSSPHGCWLWTGASNKAGYGHIGAGGKLAPVLRAHVVSWEMVNGPVTPGHEVCHTCDVFYPKGDTTYRACVRPDHLKPGTHQMNMDQMQESGRANRIGRKSS